MSVVILTKDQFQELISRIDSLSLLIESNSVKSLNEAILTNAQVQEILDISSRTLQSYRDKGLITYAQIGAKIYYRYIDINQFIENNLKKDFRKK